MDAERKTSFKRYSNEEVARIAANGTDLDDVRQLVSETTKRFGRIDILVNNSPGPPATPFEALTDDAWREAVEYKLLAQARCAREVMPGMMERRWGRIINMVGTHGRQPHAYAITAGVMNAGLLNFTKALAEAGAPANVLVNAVNPGPIETERMVNLARRKSEELNISEKEAKEILSKEILLKRFGKPEEVAATVVFLASERAGFITGTMIDVDGGQTRCI